MRRPDLSLNNYGIHSADLIKCKFTQKSIVVRASLSCDYKSSSVFSCYGFFQKFGHLAGIKVWVRFLLKTCQVQVGKCCSSLRFTIRLFQGFDLCTFKI